MAVDPRVYIRIDEATHTISVRSPFSREFVARAHELRGRWDGREWIFPLTRLDDVDAACRQIYGNQPLPASGKPPGRIDSAKPFAGVSDEDLIEELERRGYAVLEPTPSLPQAVAAEEAERKNRKLTWLDLEDASG